MMIEPTRALVAVDVNTGPDTSPAASLKANIAAARDLPRQLRLRGLGGQVVVDFAPMPKKRPQHPGPGAARRLQGRRRGEPGRLDDAWPLRADPQARPPAPADFCRGPRMSLPDLQQARRSRLPPLLLAPLRRCRSWPLADRQLRASRPRPRMSRRCTQPTETDAPTEGTLGAFSLWTAPRARLTLSPAPRQNGAQIAQLVEQRIENPRVAGSIPALGTTFFPLDGDGPPAPRSRRNRREFFFAAQGRRRHGHICGYRPWHRQDDVRT